MSESHKPTFSSPAGQSRERLPFLLYLTLAAALTLIFTWGAAEKGPTRWDDSWYLASALRLFDRFADQGVAAYWIGFRFALGDKAPLITVLPLPFFCLLGRTTFVIYCVNAVACAVLTVALYLLSRRFFDRAVSLLAVFFALTSPLLAGLSRLYLPEYWLTALAVCAMLALAKWEETGSSRWLLWLGAVCGLGLLMKVTFPLFVAPVIGVILLRVRGRRVFRILWDAMLIALPVVVLAGPWYWHNWRTVTQRSVQESYFMPVHPVAKQSPLGMAAEYFLLIANEGVSSVLVVAAAAGLIYWLAFRRDNLLRGALAYVVPWLITLPVFAVSDNRDIRLIAPMFPAFAIIAAAAFYSLLKSLQRGRSLLLSAAVTLACLITLGNSFELFGAQAWRVGPWRLFSPATAYSFRPNPQVWPLDHVLDRIAHRERIGPGSKLIIALGADTWSLNSNNLDLQAALSRYPFEFYTTAYTANTAEIHSIMSRAQYFLFKQGGTQQPADRFHSGSRTEDFLLHGPLFREVLPAIDAPDGGRIRIFESAAGPDRFFPASRGQDRSGLEAADLNFGNYLQVTGLRLTESDGLFTLALRWKCLNPPPVPLRCFAHLVDSGGKLLGAMDHEILHGSPPVHEWGAGDEGEETRRLILPAGQAAGAQVRLGVFDPETRLREPLWSSSFPVKDDFTAAVIEPNGAASAPGYFFQMAPAPLVACDVRFDDGLRLSGYSLTRTANVIWLRLRWEMPRRPDVSLRFFGHAVADKLASAPILLQFDQDTGVEKMPAPQRGSGIVFTQDVIRDASKLSGQARFLRAGIFDTAHPNDRISIRSSDLSMSREQKAVFFPLPASEGATAGRAAR